MQVGMEDRVKQTKEGILIGGGGGRQLEMTC